MILVFVSCGFVGVVGYTSALLKKCYDKYVMQRHDSFRGVMHLPDEPEVLMDDFQNLEGRYAKATVSVIHDGNQYQYRDVDLAEVRVSGYEHDELVETNIIAEEILTQNL